jgi:hypothetical protein
MSAFRRVLSTRRPPHLVGVEIARGTVIAALLVKQAATVCVYIPPQSRRDGS